MVGPNDEGALRLLTVTCEAPGQVRSATPGEHFKLPATLLLLLATSILTAACSEQILYEGRLPGDCSDAADNDLDSLFDCNDPGCAGAPACQPIPPNPAFELGPQLECSDPTSGIGRFVEEGIERGLDRMIGVLDGVGGEIAQGGGIAISDIDGDDDLDIVQGPKTLYLNDGTGYFEFHPGPITRTVELITNYMAVADLDGDGLPELIGDWNEEQAIQPRLWRNLGEASFEEVQVIEVPNNSYELANTTVTLGDVDGDGDLDLAYITGGLEAATGGGFPTSIYLYDSGAGRFEHHRDLHYDGDRDISSQIAFFVDHDSDGDQDLYVLNDWRDIGLPSALWRNDGPSAEGELQLVEYGGEVFADLDMIAMGVDSTDLNFDGRLDFCVTDVGPPRCIQSTNNGSYVEVGPSIGLQPLSGSELAFATVGWSLDFADLDNDGWVEVVQPAAPDSTAIEMGYHEFPDVLWRGLPDGNFEDVSTTVGFDSLDDHYGMATGDLNGDGYLDIVTAGPGTTPALYMNSCGEGAWLQIKLHGPAANRQGFGAQVEVDTGERVYLRELHGLRATGQSAPRLHFGLGMLQQVERITVRWPDGELSESYEIGTRRRITVRHSLASDGS